MPGNDSGKKTGEAEVGGMAFLVRVQFRQNASWQGTIQWLEGKKTMPFRSFLELVMLIQDALDRSGVVLEDSEPLRSWEDREEVS